MRRVKIKNPMILAFLEKKRKRIDRLKAKQKEYWGY